MDKSGLFHHFVKLEDQIPNKILDHDEVDNFFGEKHIAEKVLLESVTKELTVYRDLTNVRSIYICTKNLNMYSSTGVVDIKNIVNIIQ